MVDRRDEPIEFDPRKGIAEIKSENLVLELERDKIPLGGMEIVAKLLDALAPDIRPGMSGWILDGMDDLFFGDETFHLLVLFEGIVQPLAAIQQMVFQIKAL